MERLQELSRAAGKVVARSKAHSDRVEACRRSSTASVSGLRYPGTSALDDARAEFDQVLKQLPEAERLPLPDDEILYGPVFVLLASLTPNDGHIPQLPGESTTGLERWMTKPVATRAMLASTVGFQDVENEIARQLEGASHVEETLLKAYDQTQPSTYRTNSIFGSRKLRERGYVDSDQAIRADERRRIEDQLRRVVRTESATSNALREEKRKLYLNAANTYAKAAGYDWQLNSKSASKMGVTWAYVDSGIDSILRLRGTSSTGLPCENVPKLGEASVREPTDKEIWEVVNSAASTICPGLL